VDKKSKPGLHFFSKLVLCVYLKGVNAKKMAEKGEKHIEKRHFLTVQ